MLDTEAPRAQALTTKDISFILQRGRWKCAAMYRAAAQDRVGPLTALDGLAAIREDEDAQDEAADGGGGSGACV